MRTLLLVLLIVALLPACAGTRARDNALLPVANSVWPQVLVDYDLGVADGLADGDLTAEAADVLHGFAASLTEALASGNRAALRTLPWDETMRHWVIRGIDSEVEAGRLGPNGSVLLYRRAEKFNTLILVLQEKLINMFAFGPATSSEVVAPKVNPYIRTPHQRELLAAIRHDC